MKTLKSALVLAAAAAALAFAAAPTAFAGPGQKAGSPAQPIPYSQIEAYRKATPAQRASRDWSAGLSAQTGVTADTSANAPVATQPAEPSASTARSDPAPESITPSVGAVGGDTAETGGPPK